MKHLRKILPLLLFPVVQSCLPPSQPYPNSPPSTVVSQAQQLSDSLEAYIYAWTQGQVGDSIPDHLIPQGISDSRDFYLKDPDSVSSAETWAVRYARPIDRDSLLTGIPDPKITYLFLGTALAPFGSKLVIEGEFPHCRFFSLQVSPPLNGKEYYAQRMFGTAEVAIVDADIVPEPGSINPFLPGANRNATNRSYKVVFDLATGDPTTLNDTAHTYPYRSNANTRKGAMLTYQGPLGHQTVIGTPLPNPGDWNLGCLWVRIYEPDNNTDALGGVAMPKVYFELPTGERYFIGSDFSALQRRADTTIANRVVPANGVINTAGPAAGWYKSWGITRSMLNGVCLANSWNRLDSAQRVRDIDLGWTGRGEFQPAPGNIEPHATTNNYASYLGRSMEVAPGMVAVLTGKLPTFPSTRNGEAIMTTGDVRYWSICGIDQDPFSPLPATTIHAISDDDVVIDANRNYVICYSNINDRPANAQAANGVTWVDWGTQEPMGLLMRWVCIGPEWRFPLAPQEHNLDFAHSDWAGSLYDSTLIGVNWRNGFMQCYLPRVHYMTRAEFEALGNNTTAETIPVWVDSSYTKAGPAESQLGSVIASSLLSNATSDQASNAIDGNMTTAWSSAFGQPVASITADLGAVKKISAVKLNWDWIFFGKDYTVEVSANNTTWSTIASVTGENGAVDLYRNLQNISGRYVRLNLTNYNVGYYRLAEFEVYTSDCNCQPTSPSGLNNTGQNAANRLTVYPSPVNDVLHFSLDEPTPLTGGMISIYDLNGNVLSRQTLRSGSGTLDVSALPPGAYMLVSETRTGRKWSRFLKI